MTAPCSSDFPDDVLGLFSFNAAFTLQRVPSLAWPQSASLMDLSICIVV
jgi:hypothetical protein